MQQHMTDGGRKAGIVAAASGAAPPVRGAGGPARRALARHPAGVFFALAALAALALPWVWLLPLDDPRTGHLRLGLFGFGGAAVAGYVLTAQRAWTGREAPLGAAGLGALMLAARALALAAPAAVWPVALPSAGVALAILWPVVAARCWARLPLALVPLALGLAEAALVAGWLAADRLPPAMAALILAVGGRAVPAFLAAGRQRAGTGAGPAVPPLWPGLAIIAAALILPGGAGQAALCLAALWVLTRVGGAMRAGPATLMLCLGYAMLSPALVAVAAAGAGVIPALAATHLVTMAAMGAMILAVASRASMHRAPGMALRPRRRHWLAFAAVVAAALLRAAAEAAPDPLPWITASGVIWSGGWALFLTAHLAALPRPTPFPVLSAARGPRPAP